MTTKTTSKKKEWCRSLALISVFIAAICTFSTKLIAQQNNENMPTGGIENQATDNDRLITYRAMERTLKIINEEPIDFLASPTRLAEVMMKDDDNLKFFQIIETITKIADKGKHTFMIGDINQLTKK